VLTIVAIQLSTPSPGQLGDVVSALRDWQLDDSPMQLHPGDLGWSWRFGADALAAELRIWRRNEQIVAVALVDGPELVRMTVAPEFWREQALAERVVADLSQPQRGILPAGKVSVEIPDGTLVKDLLSDGEWSAGEAWTPLRRDLSEPIETPSMRIEVVGSQQVSGFTAVHRSAWGSERFTDETWHAMAAGLPYSDARCLLAYDDQGVAVAGVTVWSAGQGKPGLIEPLGVHAAHRRRGYATKICIAAAAKLKDMGSSSALVCTPSSLSSAIATYKSAGYQQLPERLDRTRDA
jgi:GNAT superfamily N-acetyltransferase